MANPLLLSSTHKHYITTVCGITISGGSFVKSVWWSRVARWDESVCSHLNATAFVPVMHVSHSSLAMFLSHSLALLFSRSLTLISENTNHLSPLIVSQAINPCLKNVCHPHASCSYLGPNRHSCVCQKGYQGDGQVCLPVDPCQTSYGNCPTKSTVCRYDGPGQVS
jgi:hypothetical protein